MDRLSWYCFHAHWFKRMDPRIIYVHAVYLKVMTSEERKDARYQRRKRDRELRKAVRSLTNSDFDKVFGFEPLIKSFKKCSRNSRWKTSVKTFGSKLTVNCAKIAKELKCDSYKSSRFRNFTIFERGHIRNVQSLHISDMTVQGSFRDNCLNPIIRPYLIYDNGACLKEKGTHFALKRFTSQLKRHIDEYGTEGYIYFFDFKSYFKNIDRKLLDELISEVLIDRRMYKYYHRFSSEYSEEGLSLGSSVSQICAVFYPNKIDHFIKDQLRIKSYGRYMDDGYIICENLSRLKDIVSEFEKKCNKCGIILNKKKCKIVKIRNHFSFLKIRFYITESGKIIRRPNKKSNVIERRKLRKFRKLIEDGQLDFKDALLYFHSWLCSRSGVSSYKSDLGMIRYFNSVFSSYGSYTPPSIKGRKTKVLLYMSTIA